MGGVNAKEDAERYRAGYPGDRDDPTQNYNLEFYSNRLKSRPHGDYIDEIHKKWFGAYDLLEEVRLGLGKGLCSLWLFYEPCTLHHGYIQWLFPIREEGVNMEAYKLQPHEAAAIAADPTLRARVITSYKLMLDFYGFRLKNEATGELERSENHRSRFHNLNVSSHNYLRVTRILKCLGEVGLEHLKVHLVRALIEEAASPDRYLTNIRRSLQNYWIPVLRNDSERAAMEQLLKDKGLWEEEVDYSQRRTGGYSYGSGARVNSRFGPVAARGGDSDEDDDLHPDRQGSAAARTRSTATGPDSGLSDPPRPTGDSDALPSGSGTASGAASATAAAAAMPTRDSAEAGSGGVPADAASQAGTQ